MWSQIPWPYLTADGRISYYRNLNNGAKTGGIPSQRRTELEDRGMLWRVAPARDLHPDEHARLRDTGT
ncbi:hypothetical protein [Streptomyces olivaceus]|uniref:hypothetical protein n=1 Tax=Streptomyces olivaceus TaxID=47716 RepID=UPI0018850C86|nr:hypothetical protein [Streptomyces olivaceus]